MKNRISPNTEEVASAKFLLNL